MSLRLNIAIKQDFNSDKPNTIIHDNVSLNIVKKVHLEIKIIFFSSSKQINVIYILNSVA